MKTTILVVSLLLILQFLSANDFQQPVMQSYSNEKLPTFEPVLSNRIDVPDVSFVIEPKDIIESFYDYMPGGYNRNPMQLQPEISMPNNFTAGGYYVLFHVTENASANTNRRVYYAYINSDGQVVTRNTISDDNTSEGFASLAIDPFTADAFAIWHAESDDNDGDIFECPMSYDVFHIVGQAGLWRESFDAIDNPDDSEPFTGHDDDEFVWPKVMIGPSPNPDKRRVHIYADNYTNNDQGHAYYNILYGYADIDTSNLTNSEELDFTFHTFSELDDLHYNDIDRSIKDMAITDDGKVAFVGWHGTDFFIEYSEDYGETFNYYTQNGRFDLDVPYQEDGETPWSIAVNDDGSVGEIFAYPSSDAGHFNAFFADDNETIVTIGAYAINRQEVWDTDQYFPALFYPKVYNFKVENDELVVDIIDLFPKGAHPNDGIPMIPWDLDEDGLVDEFYDDGSIKLVDSYPSWYFEGDFGDAFFHESLFKLTKKGKYFVGIWQDCRKHANNNLEEPGYETWSEYPEIAFTMSADHGKTWSEPAFINANELDTEINESAHYDGNYAPELNGMIPTYVYTADEMEIYSESDTEASLDVDLFFYNDYSYGSFAGQVGAGTNSGGMLQYAKVRLDCPDTTDQDEDVINIKPIALKQNYPNPFNPSTSIDFSLQQSGQIELIVYNLKGQKVKTLANDTFEKGDHQIIWNGIDDQGNAVSSGMYFYKLKSESYSVARKMLLMK